MTWIAVAVLAYLLYAIVGTVDRIIVTKSIQEPVAYVFSIGAFTGLAVLIVPFVHEWPDMQNGALAMLAGLIFLSGLIPLMTALKEGEASRVIPAVGSLTTIFTFLLAAILLDEGLGGGAILSFALLLLGSLLITLTGAWKRILTDALDVRILLASVLIAASLVLRRLVFLESDFLGAWVMFAFGMTLGAVLIVSVTAGRVRIRRALAGGRPPRLWLVGANQVGGATAAFLQNYAISLGEVALVQAMQGIQYVLLFTLTMILSKKFPNILQETFTRNAVIRKFGGTIIIGIGLIILVLV